MNFDQKHIEDYVLGRLGEEERSAFQFALMRDKNLRREVDAMRVLQKMAKAKKSKRRSLLFFSSKRIMRVAAVFIGLVTLAVLIALFSRNNEEPEFVEDEKPPAIEQQEPINEQRFEEQLIEQSPQEDLVETPEKETKNGTETKAVETPTPKEEPPKSPEPFQVPPPKRLSNIHPPTNNPLNDNPVQSLEDSSSLVQIQDTFQFKLVKEFYSDVASDIHLMKIDENGDTILINPSHVEVEYKDSSFLVEAGKEDSLIAVKRAQEMKSYPTKVKLGITAEKKIELHIFQINVEQYEGEWEPNPLLEKHMEEGIPNDSIVVNIDSDIETFARDTNAMLKLYYDCTSYGKFDDTVNLKIYSNREKELLNNLPRPMVEAECMVDELQPYSIMGNFPTGLYYLIFERKNGEFLGAQKFYVVDP